MVSTAGATARASESVPRRVGLVAPLPPQVGGVASVAGWLVDHEEAIGVHYETFDLWRPAGGEVGGRLSFAALARQAALLPRFLEWLRGAPRIVHYCVSCTRTGLTRDLIYVALLRMSGRRAIAHIQVVPERAPLRLIMLRIIDLMVVEWVGIGPATTRLLGRSRIDACWISNPVTLGPNGGAAPQSDSLRLLFVGRYGQRKGCSELLAALQLARNAGARVTLRFVGREEYDGEEAQLRAEARLRQLEDVVEFAGVAHGDALRAHYTAADVICLPSRREGLPLALIEGMAFCLPVLASPVGGIADLVEDGRSGFLVAPGDVDALGDRICILTNSERRRRMGEAARERVHEFAGEERVANGWRRLYARHRSSTK